MLRPRPFPSLRTIAAGERDSERTERLSFLRHSGRPSVPPSAGDNGSERSEEKRRAPFQTAASGKKDRRDARGQTQVMTAGLAGRMDTVNIANPHEKGKEGQRDGGRISLRPSSLPIVGQNHTTGRGITENIPP